MKRLMDSLERVGLTATLSVDMGAGIIKNGNTLRYI